MYVTIIQVMENKVLIYNLALNDNVINKNIYVLKTIKINVAHCIIFIYT